MYVCLCSYMLYIYILEWILLIIKENYSFLDYVGMLSNSL